MASCELIVLVLIWRKSTNLSQRYARRTIFAFSLPCLWPLTFRSENYTTIRWCKKVTFLQNVNLLRHSGSESTKGMWQTGRQTEKYHKLCAKQFSHFFQLTKVHRVSFLTVHLSKLDFSFDITLYFISLLTTIGSLWNNMNWNIQSSYMLSFWSK